LYKVLGIASTADYGRIKSAFRSRAKAFHPDLNPGDSYAEERFKELTQAYEVLKSAHARAQYDALLARRRGQMRWRMAGSAATMAASFVLTLGSAYAVLSLHDGGSRLHEGWQVAMSSLRVGSDRETRPQGAPVAVANAVPPATSATEVAKSAPAGPDAPSLAAKAGPQQPGGTGESAPAQARKPMPDGARARSRVATAVPRQEPAADNRVPSDVPGESSWPWPTAADEPRMSLGAANR
jgi:curved DNA-binding protein CbpA